MTRIQNAHALLFAVGLGCCAQSPAPTPRAPSPLTAVDRLIQPGLSELKSFAREKSIQPAEPLITVAPSADDSATIDRALVQARVQRANRGGAVTILFRPGIYHLSRPLRLTSADSGMPGAPLRLQGDLTGPVILAGTLPLARAALPAELTRLISPNLRNRVQGFAVPPSFAPQPPFPSRASMPEITRPTLIVTQGDQWLQRSTWPEHGYQRQVIAHPQIGPAVAPIVALPANLGALLAGEPALSTGGYWTFDWFYEERPVAGLAPRHLRVGALTSNYPQANAIRFRLLNGFSLLMKPGDMAYADGHLAALPYAAVESIEASRLDTVIAINDAHDVVLDGLAVRGARATGITVDQSRDILFSNGYVGLAGGGGIGVSNSERVVVYRSVVADVGETGVALRGSENGSPARNAVIDTLITATGGLTRAYAPAVRLTGVGQVVAGDLITGLPHAAIIFNGRDHAIVGNEIAHTTQETADAGAVYSFGSLTTRGTVIAYNYFHDIVKAPGLDNTIANQVRTIYLDSWTSGEIIAGNLFLRSAWPFWINSGEKNRVEGNVFADTGPSGRLYDISNHWYDGLGDRIRHSMAGLDPHDTQLRGIRPGSSLFTTGRGSENVVAGNISIRSDNAIVDPSLASLQNVQPNRVLPSPSGSVEPMPLLKLARNAGLDLTASVRSRTAELSSLRYANLAAGSLSR
jgi:hypothetical protein